MSFAGWLIGAAVLVVLAGLCAGLVAFKPVVSQVAPRRLPPVQLALLGLVFVLALIPQLRAFPAHGTLAERDAWARQHVREYPGLVRVVKRLPALTRDLGRVLQVAPSARHKHAFAREMNGDDRDVQAFFEKRAPEFRGRASSPPPFYPWWALGEEPPSKEPD